MLLENSSLDESNQIIVMSFMQVILVCVFWMFDIHKMWNCFCAFAVPFSVPFILYNNFNSYFIQ